MQPAAASETLYASLLSTIANGDADEGYHGQLTDLSGPPRPQLVSVDAAGATGVSQLRGGACGAAWTPPIPVSDTPRIYVVDDFATAEECQEVFAAFEPGLEE